MDIEYITEIFKSAGFSSVKGSNKELCEYTLITEDLYIGAYINTYTTKQFFWNVFRFGDNAAWVVVDGTYYQVELIIPNYAKKHLIYIMDIF